MGHANAVDTECTVRSVQLESIQSFREQAFVSFSLGINLDQLSVLIDRSPVSEVLAFTFSNRADMENSAQRRFVLQSAFSITRAFEQPEPTDARPSFPILNEYMCADTRLGATRPIFELPSRFA